MKTGHVYSVKAVAAAAIGAVFFLAATVTSAAAMGEEIVGKIVRDDSGYTLVAPSGQYMLTGKSVADLSGKKVVVDGDVEYGVKNMTMDVSSARILHTGHGSNMAAAGGRAQQSG